MKIRRIVKMTFQPGLARQFLEIFDESKRDIRRFPGCLGLQLLRGTDLPDTLFTLSDWEGEAALDGYRQSELFQKTWARVKPLFSEKPEAHSVFVFDELE